MVENLLDIAMFILFLSLLVALPWHLIPETANDGIRSISPCAPMSHKVSFVFFLLIWIAVVLYHIVSVINGGWESSAKLWPMLGITLPLFSATSVNRFEIRVAGINSQGHFTKWKNINAFRWKEEGDYKLGLGNEAYILGLIKSGDSFPWWLEWDKFQRCQRENADKLLSQFLPNKT